jgi:hypothetical protein
LHALFLTTSQASNAFRGRIELRSRRIRILYCQDGGIEAKTDVGPVQVLDILNVEVDDHLPPSGAAETNGSGRTMAFSLGTAADA